MKKFRMGIVFIVMFMISVTGVSAVCEASDENKINNEALKVRVSYELVKEELEAGTFTPPDGIPEDEIDNYTTYVSFFKIYITNLTENLYVEVKDTFSGESKKYTYQDSDNGTVVLESRHIDAINEYTINVYTTNQECSARSLVTLTQKLPKYNEYHYMGICDGLEDYYLCREYINYDIDYSFEEVVDKIDAYVVGKEQQEAAEEENNRSFFEKNKNAIIVSSVVIVAAGVAIVVVIIVRKRRVV